MTYKLKTGPSQGLKLKGNAGFALPLIGRTGVKATKTGGIWYLDLDYSELVAVSTVSDETAYILTWDSASGIYTRTNVTDLKAEIEGTFDGYYQPLDATLTALAALDSTAGLLAQTGADTFARRTLTGTANEITVTNGDGVAGNPTVSLPSALTFAGKTVTGGTYTGLTITNSTYNGNTWTAGTGTLTLGAGKTATISNTLTFTGADSSSIAFGAGGTVAYQGGTLAQFAATTSAQLAGVISDETGSGALVFGTSPNITTPTGIVKGDVGLGNVDNTSDANKPVSTATQTALDLKANTADLGDLALKNAITVPADITATGIASATTYLRGDGSWSTPAGGGSSQFVSITDYGASGDGKTAADGAVTASSTAFTSAGAAFTSGDVGKAIWIGGAGTSGADLLTTISAVGSGTAITLTDAAATTVSAATYWFGTDNSAAIAAAETAAANVGSIYFPDGTFLFTGTVNKANGVDWWGQNKNSVILKYLGATCAIDAQGTSSARRIFSIRSLSITSPSYLNSAIGIKLAWNMRSLPILSDVGINTFGSYAIAFYDQNWLVYFDFVEIHDTGRGVTQGTAIYFDPAATAIADIRFNRCVLESNGKEGSTDSGSVQAYANSPYKIQGLVFDNCDIEGNFGSYQGGSFKRVDNLVISNTYSETALFAASARNCFRIESCEASITGCRITSDAGNTTGYAIATVSSNIRVSGSTFDPDYGAGDISLATGTWLSTDNEFANSVSPLRLVKDSTSGLVGGGMVAAAWGRFDGTTGTLQAGYNISSVTRASAGSYTVNFIKSMPSTKYVVVVNAESGTYLTMAGMAGNVNNVANFSIKTTDVSGGSAVATDGRQVSFVVFAELKAP